LGALKVGELLLEGLCLAGLLVVFEQEGVEVSLVRGDLELLKARHRVPSEELINAVVVEVGEGLDIPLRLIHDL
jgi:hypothetical protein